APPHYTRGGPGSGKERGKPRGRFLPPLAFGPKPAAPSGRGGRLAGRGEEKRRGETNRSGQKTPPVAGRKGGGRKREARKPEVREEVSRTLPGSHDVLRDCWNF